MRIKWRLILTYVIGLLLPLVLWFLMDEPKVLAADEPFMVPVFAGQEYVYASDAEREELDAFAKEVEQAYRQNPDILKNRDYRLMLRERLGGRNAVFLIDEKKGEFLRAGNSLLWATNVDVTVGDYKFYYSVVFGALAVFYLLGFSILAYWMMKSITVPLKGLKVAAAEIAEGNMGYRIGHHEADEIGEVGRVFDDMAERMATNMEQMRRYDENRKNLLANISHDLRTPLTAMRVCVDAVKDGVAETPEKRDKYLGILQDKMTHIEHMLDTLMLYSKLDLKQEVFQRQEVPLNRLLEDLMEEWQSTRDEKHVQMTLSYDEKGDHIVEVDVAKLARVLFNIFDNAEKYSGVTPLLIHVKLFSNDGGVRVCIRDNGKGIPDAETDYLFERFYRSADGRGDSQSGHGLGLSIARQIIEGHGGTIGFVNDGGIGFGIEFNLPKGGTNEKDSDH